MLTDSVTSFIKDQMPAAIQAKRLTPELLDLIYTYKWFNLWVPKAYGGLGYGLSEGCALLEELAYEDGGLGWTVTLCSGANMFAGFINPALAESIFSKSDVCWGGSGKPDGKAVKTEGGYVLTGFWKYATGAPHLTHFTLNAWLYEGDSPVLNDAGEQVYHSFFVDRDQVLVHYDWDTFGLEVTASHSFSVDGVYVDAEQAFDLMPDQRTSEEPIFHYPFYAFAICTLAANYIGMFRKFIQLYEKQLLLKSNDKAWHDTKGKSLFQQLDAITQVFEVKRKVISDFIDRSWSGDLPDEEGVELLHQQGKELVAFIREECSRLFPNTGITGAQRDSEINRVFRNIFTATQHALLGN